MRRRGPDPVQDRAAVRGPVDEVIADDDERARTSSLVPLHDAHIAARAVYGAVAGFGPPQRHLNDRTVEEIWINEPGRVFVARRGRSELTTTILAEGQVRDLVERMLKTTGRRWSSPLPLSTRHSAHNLFGATCRPVRSDPVGMAGPQLGLRPRLGRGCRGSGRPEPVSCTAARGADGRRCSTTGRGPTRGPRRRAASRRWSESRPARSGGSDPRCRAGRTSPWCVDRRW